MYNTPFQDSRAHIVTSTIMIGTVEINCNQDESLNDMETIYLNDQIGRGMRAKRNFFQGEIILQEPPLVFIRSDVVLGEEMAELASLHPSIDIQLFIYYDYYKKQSLEMRSRIDDFYSGHERSSASAVASSIREALVEEGLESIVDVEDFVRIAMIFHYNGAEITPPPADGSSDSVNLGIGLFPIACRISHSCSASTCWYSNDDGWRVVQAIVDIPANAEVTVDYTMEGLLLTPTFQRLQYLSTHFICQCERCNNPLGDDTRQFRCISTSCYDSPSLSASACPGHHRPVINSTGSDDFLPCDVCSALSTPAYTYQMLCAENELAATVDTLLEAVTQEEYSYTDDAPINHTITNLTCPLSFSSSHYLSFLVAKVQFLFYNGIGEIGDVPMVLMSKRAQITAMSTITRQRPSRLLAFEYERLGEAYKDIGDREAALSAYTTALGLHRIVSGLNGPYTCCGERSMLSNTRPL
jgi:hypothetical protein